MIPNNNLKLEVLWKIMTNPRKPEGRSSSVPTILKKQCKDLELKKLTKHSISLEIMKNLTILLIQLGCKICSTSMTQRKTPKNSLLMICWDIHRKLRITMPNLISLYENVYLKFPSFIHYSQIFCEKPLLPGQLWAKSLKPSQYNPYDSNSPEGLRSSLGSAYFRRRVCS